MPAAQSTKERKHQIMCIIGMAMVWPSLHNQLLYPVTFSFHKDGADAPYLYYLIYSLILLGVALFIAFSNRERITKHLFANRKLMGLIGLFGAIGITLLVICDFSHDLSRWLMGLGVVFAAAFVPIYFTFWSAQLTYSSEKRASFDLAISYLLFCIITLIRLALDLHAWPFSICYPLISGGLAVYILKDPPKKRYALSKTSITMLPLYLVIPSVLFIYMATIARCLMNPMTAAHDYPPSQRTTVYIIMGIVSIVLALLYRPHSSIRRYANLPAFALTVGLLAVGILLTGLGTFDASTLGNLPAISGINAMELLVWLFVLANAQVKHAGILRSAALYLIFVIGGCHLITVLFMMGVDAYVIDPTQLPLLAITITLAFLIIIAVNTTMTAMLYNAQKRSRSVEMPVAKAAASIPMVPTTDVSTLGTPPPVIPPGQTEQESKTKGILSPVDELGVGVSAPLPPCLTLTVDEAALEKIKTSFKLSKREVDTMRLASRNASTKEIAECLFVAESTVNSHLKSIYRKCDIHSRKELIALVNRYKREQSQ